MSTKAIVAAAAVSLLTGLAFPAKAEAHYYYHGYHGYHHGPLMVVGAPYYGYAPYPGYVVAPAPTYVAPPVVMAPAPVAVASPVYVGPRTLIPAPYYLP